MDTILRISRWYNDDCTLGRGSYQGMHFYTLELPDKDNQVNISCIPEGTYNCQLITSPSLGKCINVSDVDGRTFIRIHAGNFTSQILGCILVGNGIKHLNRDNIPDVTSSKRTLNKLMEKLPLLFKMEIS